MAENLAKLKRYLPSRPHDLFWRLFSFIAMIFLNCSGCQRAPALAPAADNLSPLELPPMGAQTYNDEMKRQLNLLDDLLDGRLNEQRLQKIKNAMIQGENKGLSLNPSSDDQHFVKIFMKLPELVQGKVFDKNEKSWLKAKFYFANRRFVEASLLMTEILRTRDDPKVRIIRARTAFILGNPDFAVKELESVLNASHEKSPEYLEVLYLIGAMRYEAHDVDEARIKSGINAWTRYLALAELGKAEEEEIKKGLSELKNRLPGHQVFLAKAPIDPFLPDSRYSDDKNAIMNAFKDEKLLLALELCEHFLKQNHDDDIATIKARILFKTGKVIEASQLFADIIAKNSQYAPAFHYQGMTFMFLGRPKEAILSWERAIALNQTYGDAHNLRQRIAIAKKMSEQR